MNLFVFFIEFSKNFESTVVEKNVGYNRVTVIIITRETLDFDI